MSARTIEQPGAQRRALIAGTYFSGMVFNLAQHVAGLVHRQIAGTNKLTLCAALEHTNFRYLNSRLQSGMPPSQPVAFFAPIISPVGKGETVRNGGLLGSVRDFNTLTPPLTLEIVSGGSSLTEEHIMANHAQGVCTPAQCPTTPFNTGALTADQYFQATFHNGCSQCSHKYKAVARMALEHLIERQVVEQPYRVGTAAADAYFASIRRQGHLERRCRKDRWCNMSAIKNLLQPTSPTNQKPVPALNHIDALGLLDRRHQQVPGMLGSIFMTTRDDSAPKELKNSIWAVQELLEQVEDATVVLDQVGAEHG